MMVLWKLFDVSIMKIIIPSAADMKITINIDYIFLIGAQEMEK